MPLPTWALLEKSLIDSEKIEAAINRLIAAHNDDANAHIGAGRSLNSHKAAAIIDHLAVSIIADKIKDFEVPVQKLLLNKTFIQSHFESLDAWDTYGTGETSHRIGGTRIRSTTTADTYRKIVVPFDLIKLDFDLKNPVFETILELSHNTSQLAYFGIGDRSDWFMGFKVSNGTLYAYWMKNGSEYSQEITGITITNLNRYRIVMDSGTDMKFYIDDVLKATITTNLPNTSDCPELFHYYIKTTVAAYREMIIAVATFYQDT